MATTTDFSTIPYDWYIDPAVARLEQERIFRRTWQYAAHTGELAEAGSFVATRAGNVPAVIVRGRDKELRAFVNVCRHRGYLLCDGAGKRETLQCPYHAWTYDLDGTLSGVPDSASYPGLDKARHGLAPVDLEIWRGFVFVRLAGDGPGVAEMMAPYAALLEPYRFEELRALGRVTLRPRAVNWKIIGDNYSDGLHIAVAHPGLNRLFGKSYGVEATEHVDRMWGELQDRPSANWSERAYQRLLPPIPHLPPERQRSWQYLKLWPNIAFDIYPDQIDFMQWLPISPTKSLIREIGYAIPDADSSNLRRREMRATRYLNWRINRQVNAEDTTLIARVQQGMTSRSFTAGPLSIKEVCLRRFCQRMRDAIPEARFEQAPPAVWSRG